MKKKAKAPKRQNAAAKSLADRKFAPKIIPNKKKPAKKEAGLFRNVNELLRYIDIEEER